MNNRAIVTIPANIMNITDKYTVTVFVTAKDGRSSSAIMVLLPSPPLSPVVSIFSPKARVNVDAKLSLSGFLKANYSVSAVWSVCGVDRSTPVNIEPVTPSSSIYSAISARSKVLQVA